MIYNSLNDLEGNILNPGDIVYFYINNIQLKYYVQSNHLTNTKNWYNAEIFSILGIKKDDFCKRHYGYPPYEAAWPACKSGDFAALTRVVRALYLEIESRKIRENTVYLDDKNFRQELKINLRDILMNTLISPPLTLEKKEDTSSNILVVRKSKIKRIIGEEPIKLNNY